MERHDPPPGALEQIAPAAMPWVGLKDDELLQKRICDLGVRIPGSELEGRITQLYDELGAHGLAFRPPCYLGDEWFSPAGAPAIAIPFYLAHPRLKTLEMHQMLQVEGGTPEWCLELLRHESGHAIDHAYRFSSRDDWHGVFGSPETEYSPETYHPRPYSKGFVRNLPNWYAQAHPDEDFAETFAVWLSLTPEQWREQYRGWKALDKLEFVHCLMEEAKNTPPKVKLARRIYEASRLRKTLARYYTERRKLYAEDFPDFYDADLRVIFGTDEPNGESAAKVMRRNRPALVASIVRWTGQHKYTVDMLVRKLIERCQKLKLTFPPQPDRARVSFELAAYLSAMVTNHLHTGRFKRSV
ncbi:MAG TPA: putative zinc-binding metallopeptidase [Bryobacteraceae bacterium]|nr:putative zinc-binding metallopeptidase [Bryobacteraceae bacterium]